MPHYVYVIYSPSLDRFYTGVTVSVEERKKEKIIVLYVSNLSERLNT